MNELRTQAVIAAACKDLGGYGIKLQNRHLAGIPDLFLAHPEAGLAFVEVKLKGGRPTVLQEETIKRMQAAGVPAGFMCVQHVTGGVADIWTARAWDDVNTMGPPIRKLRGGVWPVIEIIKMCQPVA